jgi:general secretion pathway protein E
LMVMAHLLTYRLDVPQEGRARAAAQDMDLRVSVMPTVHGLRAAVRMPAELVQPRALDELGLNENVRAGLKNFAAGDCGMLILTGPAGSGKTTTIYALLEHIVATSPGISVVALEDPVERALAGVTQIEVTPFGELSYERALRSILRQDPQVLMLGEIRDSATASAAIAAALSGHRMISTMHAGSCAGAIARLLEMGIEPYQISSALFGVMAQRLIRRRAAAGYHGRIALAELVTIDDAMRKGILARQDAQTLERIYAGRPDFVSIRQAGFELISSGVTDAQEVRRVLGERSEKASKS